MTIEFGPWGGPLLAVFAKRPSTGKAKTRLAQATSADWALAAAQAMLEDSLDRFATIDLDNPTARQIVYAPADATEYFAKLSNGRFELALQTDGDLGNRLRSFFDQSQEHYKNTIVVGTDSPTLPIQYVADAIRALKTHDLVIGPAFDGGFYLLGMAEKRLRPFHGIAWSTSRVLDQMLDQVGSFAKVAILAPWYDIDTADDWAMMRGHTKAMRRAGIDPGVPRLERLMNDSREFV
jgi:rSAM/selenodomain-associated transferase 1